MIIPSGSRTYTTVRPLFGPALACSGSDIKAVLALRSLSMTLSMSATRNARWALPGVLGRSSVGVPLGCMYSISSSMASPFPGVNDPSSDSGEPSSPGSLNSAISRMASGIPTICRT